MIDKETKLNKADRRITSLACVRGVPTGDYILWIQDQVYSVKSLKENNKKGYIFKQ